MLLIWWIVWAVILVGLVMLYVFFGRGPVKPAPATDIFVNLVGLVPLFVSIVIRWLVLPRFDSLPRAFPIYIVGLALAEGCGVLGLFVGGPYRDDLFVLGVLGVAQYVPLFAKRLSEPKPVGFIPNN
jgi:tellurite resistance protein TehA-like permease